MEGITYEDALNYYYSYKQKYEKKYNSRKGKIINDSSLSKKQKQSKIKTIKMPCISCKKAVGTTFEDKNRTLTAVCGNQESPCKLNIQIKKADTFFTDTYIPSLLVEKHSLENDIIRLKLAFLFGFIDGDELRSVFDELKEKIGDNTELLELSESFLKDSLELEARREQIRVLNVEKYNNIKEIKNMMGEFIVTKDASMLKDVVTINIENMEEVMEKLRANKYREMFVEIDHSEQGNIVRLIQNENSISDKEYEVNDGDVLQYVI
tara:strand:- start:61 stop:855 length:795 start_codon:yes stop_codon:yes gene_type:complete